MKTSNENEEEMEEREWVINGFKTFSAVAQEYFPEYSNADTPSTRMRNEIALDKLLFDTSKSEATADPFHDLGTGKNNPTLAHHP